MQDKDILVCDTTVLLYLERIGQTRLLPLLFEAVRVPEPVLVELDMGRLIRTDTIDPRKIAWMQIVRVSDQELLNLPPNRLGTGERAAIAHAKTLKRGKVGLDDRQAREMAASLHVKVIGTLGILLLAKRHDLIPSLRPCLDALQCEGFRMNSQLVQEALQLAGEPLPSAQA